MARSLDELSRLARELASLTPEERLRVMLEAARQQKFHPLPPDFTPPRLGSGGTWTGGSLRREELYGEDGR
jgi:hypothetical protein